MAAERQYSWADLHKLLNRFNELHIDLTSPEGARLAHPIAAAQEDGLDFNTAFTNAYNKLMRGDSTTRRLPDVTEDRFEAPQISLGTLNMHFFDVYSYTTHTVVDDEIDGMLEMEVYSGTTIANHRATRFRFIGHDKKERWLGTNMDEQCHVSAVDHFVLIGAGARRANGDWHIYQGQ